MSEGIRKNLRTQGRYSDGREQKNRDKKQKSSISPKDTLETRYPKKNSGGTKGINSSLSDEGASPLRYEENSDYTFRELEEPTKPEEIKGRGKRILSKTENGESIVYYEPDFLQCDEGDDYFDRLYETINFDARNIVIHGVEYPQPRLVAWFGPFEYKYSGTTLEPAEMPDTVLEIKERVEKLLKSQDMEASFNSVLVNLYRDGKDSVAWHSDDELMLGMSPTIASVSLGETRKFQMRPKNYNGHCPDTPPKYVVHLTHGSLIVMTGSMQDDWQHRVPKEYHDRGPRINLTFRTVYPLEEAPEHAAAKGINLKNGKTQPDDCNSSSKFLASKYVVDDENFPSLQKNLVSAKSNVTRDLNDNTKSNFVEEDTDEKSWDSDHDEQNVDNAATDKNSYPTFDKRDKDFKPKNYEKNHFSKKKKSEKWRSIEPYSGNEKNPLDDKTGTKKLWREDTVSGSRGNKNVKERYNTNYSQSAPNLMANEENEFRNKTGPRKVRDREASLSGKSFKQNITSQEKCSIKSFTKANSHANFTEENNTENQEPPNMGYAFENESWADSSKECYLDVQTAKMPLNADAEAFNNFSNSQEKNDLEHKQIQCVENNSCTVPSEENVLNMKQSMKIELNVDAKEFIPSNIKSNEVNTFSALNYNVKEFIPVNLESVEVNEFSKLDLDGLVNYDVNCLEGKDLQDHVKYLKIQIEERLQELYDRRRELNRYDRRDLEFLMEISDGSQSDKNQRLITEQMCSFVQSKLHFNRSSWNAPQSFNRNSRQHGYDQNRGKRYQNRR